MAVTDSENYGFPMATSGSDPTPNRAAWMAIFDALEGKALAIDKGTLAERPSAPTSPLAWFDTGSSRLSLHTGTGGSWVDISAQLATSTPKAGSLGGAGKTGTSDKTARADHVHPLPAIKRGDLPAIKRADLPTVPVSKGGTGKTTLDSGAYVRGNGTSAVSMRTPAQVRTDIGAAKASAGVPSGGSTGDVLKQTASGPAWGSGTVTSSDITDATTIGKDLIKAANQAAARSAIGAGTSNFGGAYSALTGKPTIGTLGGVPTSRKINGHALTADVTLTPNDLGAVDTSIKQHGTASGSVTLDLGDAPNHVVKLNGDTTVSFDGLSGSGRMHQIRLFLSQTYTPFGHDVTWPASVTWPDGEPDYSTGPDEIVFTTIDGGSTVLGFHVASYGSNLVPAIGDSFLGGRFIGIIDTNSVTFASGESSTHRERNAVAVMPGSDQSPSNLKYKEDRTADPFKSDWDGLRATAAFVADSKSYPAAEYCDGLSVPADGGSKAYLPSRAELLLAYYAAKPTTDSNNTSDRTGAAFPWDPVVQGVNRYSDPATAAWSAGSPSQTTVAAWKSGGADAFPTSYHWSSTPYSASYGWVLNFYTGSQGSNYKDYYGVVRPFRRIKL